MWMKGEAFLLKMEGMTPLLVICLYYPFHYPPPPALSKKTRTNFQEWFLAQKHAWSPFFPNSFSIQ